MGRRWGGGGEEVGRRWVAVGSGEGGDTWAAAVVEKCGGRMGSNGVGYGWKSWDRGSTSSSG